MPNMTKSEILEEFLKVDLPLIKDMKYTEHSENHMNPYHLEGNVWSHTMMVFNSIPENADIELKLAALLHDTGKPYVRFTKKGKTYFTGHEGMSVFKSLKFLKYLVITKKITGEEMITTLNLINHHGIFYKYKDNAYEMINKLYSRNLLKLIDADKNGRIASPSISNTEIIPSKIEYIIPNHDNTSPECIFMIGFPGSGKSRYIDENLKNSKNNYTILSRDEILVQYGKEKYGIEEYRDIWDKLEPSDQKEIDKILDKRMKEAIKNKENIIIDMTNISKKSRMKKHHLIPKEYRKNAIIMIRSIEDALKSEQERKKLGNGAEGIIISFAKNFEIPFGDEGFDDVLTIVY